MDEQQTQPIKLIEDDEEPRRDIKVWFENHTPRIFKGAEYFVAQNRTLIIGAQVTKAQRDEQLKRYGYIQAIVTYNKNVWNAVEVVDENQNDAA
jgi:hypothetical protein